MKGLSRIDQPEKHNHGWFIRLPRKKKMYSAFCSDKKCGGKAKGLIKAKAIYAKLAKQHPPMSRKEFAQVVRRPNKTGIPGVTKSVKFVGRKKYAFWLATWSPEIGVVAKRSFSVNRHGDLKAKKLAVRARKAGLAKMG